MGNPRDLAADNPLPNISGEAEKKTPSAPRAKWVLEKRKPGNGGPITDQLIWKLVPGGNLRTTDVYTDPNNEFLGSGLKFEGFGKAQINDVKVFSEAAARGEFNLLWID